MIAYIKRIIRMSTFLVKVTLPGTALADPFVEAKFLFA